MAGVENLDPGNETHRFGDHVTAAVPDGVTVEAGQAVQINADTTDSGLPVVEPADDGGVFGVVSVTPPHQPEVTVTTSGTLVADVVDSVEAGDDLGSPDTVNGEPAGTLSATGSGRAHAVLDANAEGYAEVYLF